MILSSAVTNRTVWPHSSSTTMFCGFGLSLSISTGMNGHADIEEQQKGWTQIATFIIFFTFYMYSVPKIILYYLLIK